MNLDRQFENRLHALFPHSAQVIGGGIEGCSTARFLQRYGIRTVLRDRNPEFTAPEDLEAEICCGEGYLRDIPANATIMRSAGVRFDLPAFQTHRAAGGTVLSQVRLFCTLYHLLHPEGKIVGVTATMGKGTTCTFLSEMLKAAGISHTLLGNFGTPMLDSLQGGKLPDAVILELSSFQLSDFCPGDGVSAADIAPDIAIFGHVTIEHLDWHRDQVEYWNSKANLAAHQAPEQLAVHLTDDPGSLFCGMAGHAGRHTLGPDGDLSIDGSRLRDASGNVLLEVSELKVPGTFQLENAGLAWLAARQLGVSDALCRIGAASFSGLRHRLMYAGSADGIRYYDDSYATRPDAAIAAIRTFDHTPLAIILGGSDKKIDFTEFTSAIRKHPTVRYIALIGATAPILAKSFAAGGTAPFPVESFPDLPRAFAACETALGKTGGALLMSPACASFGLFRNYKERGEAFLRLAAERTGKSV